MRAVYAAALTITDKWLGSFLDAFEDIGLADNTAIVFVSDHGILLGDRGWTGKIAQELHPELIQVPCVIVHPRAQARRAPRAAYFASTPDIAPTLLGARRRATPRPAWTGWTSRRCSTARSRHAASSPTAATSTTSTSAPTSGRFVADNRGDHRELYDLNLDPAELSNVARRESRTCTTSSTPGCSSWPEDRSRTTRERPWSP